jgi:hypothetical protein
VIGSRRRLRQWHEQLFAGTPADAIVFLLDRDKEWNLDDFDDLVEAVREAIVAGHLVYLRERSTPRSS